jgi:hypothetical protein
VFVWLKRAFFCGGVLLGVLICALFGGDFRFLLAFLFPFWLPLVVFGSEGWGVLLPGEFFCFCFLELVEVCFFTASLISFLMCCSRVIFAVDVFSTAIAVASVALRISVFLNSADSRYAAFFILFSFSIVACSLVVMGKIRLISLSEMLS